MHFQPLSWELWGFSLFEFHQLGVYRSVTFPVFKIGSCSDCYSLFIGVFSKGVAVSPVSQSYKATTVSVLHKIFCCTIMAYVNEWRERTAVSEKLEMLRKKPFKLTSKKIWRRNLLPEQGWEFEEEALLGPVTDDCSCSHYHLKEWNLFAIANLKICTSSQF